MHRLSLHIFRRDLRIHDNTALLQALEESEQVIPCFIFDPRQVKKHAYYSKHALQFMLESLKDLDTELRARGSKLYVFEGNAESILATLVTEKDISAVYVNEDYTPFSKKRDRGIEKVCKKNEIAFISTQDALLTTPGKILTGSNTPYTVFTPFYKKARQIHISKPRRCTKKNMYTGRIIGSTPLESSSKKLLTSTNDSLAIHGGRTAAKKLLHAFAKKTYAEERNIPSASSTSLLSAHHKFGTLSIRESYHWAARLGIEDRTQFRQELFWRDFFTHIAHFFPRVFSGPFREQYSKIPWSENKKMFRAWCNGETGFPIVDAGMRELNATGYMHNRVRMIVASFLVKDLHINWQWGEKYFAQQLVDYDPAVNNGNWQWAASTGCDAQPYFRIFNPWRQQKQFDPECLYIKKWVPELSSLSPTQIHALEKTPLQHNTYPTPIVDHSNAAAKAKALFKK